VASESPKVEKNREENPDLLASRKWSRALAQLADGRHCSDIAILELADFSPVAMHFVVCTGTSEQQIRSVAREMEQLGKESQHRAYGTAGLQQGRWVIIDFVDVVVHLFDDEFRKFYDLELLWGDAPRIDWQSNEANG